MTDTISASSGRFVFTVTEDETLAYGRIIAAKQARKARIGYSFLAIVFSVPVLGIFVLGAAQVGFITQRQIEVVLVTAILGYFLGFFVNHFETRRAGRLLARNLYRRQDMAAHQRELTIEPQGITWVSPSSRIFSYWNGVNAIEDRELFVLIWVGVTALPIPKRIFANTDECDAFVARLRSFVGTAP